MTMAKEFKEKRRDRLDRMVAALAASGMAGEFGDEYVVTAAINLLKATDKELEAEEKAE